MRIHTKLTRGEILDARTASGLTLGRVAFAKLEEHKSSSHARAFEVALTGSGPYRTQDGENLAATWDEWGAVMAAIFDADPDARMGGTAKRPIYADRDHFHFATGDRFHKRVTTKDYPLVSIPLGYTYMPEDTHPRHSWDYNGAGFECRKCSATRPSVGADMTYRDAHQIGA